MSELIDLSNLDVMIDYASFGIKVIVYVVIGVSIFYVMFKMARRIRERILL